MPEHWVPAAVQPDSQIVAGIILMLCAGSRPTLPSLSMIICEPAVGKTTSSVEDVDDSLGA